MYSRGAGVLARALLREQVLECFAILKIHGHVKIARHVRLPDIELLKKRGEEFTGGEIYACGIVILRPAFCAGRGTSGVVGSGAGVRRRGAACRLHRSFASLRMTRRKGACDFRQIFPEKFAAIDYSSAA